jgi:aryl-phospho-beta-D-glucosidase BglC (GH1 family)
VYISCDELVNIEKRWAKLLSGWWFKVGKSKQLQIKFYVDNVPYSVSHWTNAKSVIVKLAYIPNSSKELAQIGFECDSGIGTLWASGDLKEVLLADVAQYGTDPLKLKYPAPSIATQNKHWLT